MGSIGNEPLGSVEDIVVTVQNRAGLEGCGVRSCIGFRQAKGAEIFAAGQPWQI
jgi:hypothetical protein